MTHSVSRPPSSIDKLLNRLQEIREIFLANAVLLGEIPAPTFHEDARIQFLLDRFTESRLQNISRDETGNGLAIMPGSEDASNILLVAHADTPFDASINHTVSVHTDTIEGPGICDNSLGLAALASLPTILEHLGIYLKSNLILMGSTKCLGRGNLKGLRFFLDHNEIPIKSAICIEGVQLGRLSYSSIGMLRGEIVCHVPSSYDWSKFGAMGAISHMNQVINAIQRIPLPSQPKTSIILGSISGGNAYNTMATQTKLRFEVRSEQAGMVSQIQSSINEIIEEHAAQKDVELTLEVIARRSPGGIAYGHPLVKTARQIMQDLSIKPLVAPSAGELSLLIAHNIPGITLGLTEGVHLHEENESARIEPMFRGLAQLIGVLKAIDLEYYYDKH